jgi:hypothetical protein
VRQVGNQSWLYYDARSTNHQDISGSWFRASVMTIIKIIIIVIKDIM